ncbi:hypothetical protein NUM3379_23790 [Kineococcus sp. NUM-3379]
MSPDTERRGAGTVAAPGRPAPEPDGGTVGELAVPACVVDAATPALDVDGMFRLDPSLRSVLVDGPDGIRLVDRTWFALTMAGRLGFGRGLHARRTIGELQIPPCLVLDARVPVARAAELLLGRPVPRRAGQADAGVHDDVVVVGPGRDPGVVPVAAVFERLAAHHAHQALHDPLTGLPNRSYLVRRLREAGRDREPATLLHLDLDGFRELNDTHGHAAGDEVLRHVARRLHEACRDADLVVRLGGDAFAVLVCQEMTTAESRALAQRLLEEVATPFTLSADGTGAAPVRLPGMGAGIGVAHTDGLPGPPEDGALEELLARADFAVYRAKGRGPGRVEHFDPVSDASGEPGVPSLRALRAQRGAARRLRAAVREERLELHYQPLVELPSGRVVGAEALVRWDDPERGPVPPSEFVPLAERSGLVHELGRWVLHAACAEAAGWRGSAAGASVAVNVSAVQLAEPTLVHDVTAALERSGLQPHRLCLEVTETAAIADLEEAARRLGELRDLGVRLALDDFCTGHSSLTMLRVLPVHTVKIDRSFVERVAGSTGDAVLVRLLVDAAHSLGHRVCAEGVESEEQARQLVALGCDLAQGWLFGRPAPPSQGWMRGPGAPAGGRELHRPGSGGPALPPGDGDRLVLVTDVERTIRYVSASCAPLLGWVPGDLVGTSIRDHVHAEDLTRLHGGEQLRARGVPSTATFRVRHADGGHRWFRCTSQWTGGDGGRGPEVLTLCHDVTDAVEAGRALTASEERFRLLFEEGLEGMVLADLDGRVVRVNQAFADLLGSAPEALRGRLLHDLLHPGERSRVAELLAPHPGAPRLRARYLHSGGPEVPVELRASLLGGDDGAADRLLLHVVPAPA